MGLVSIMTHRHQEKIDEFVAACRKVCACGLLRYSSGNMSCRLDGGIVAVSARGAWLGEMTADEVAICRLADGKSINDKQPTAENGFHLGILRSREDANVVLHFQSPFATAIACGAENVYNFDVIPELPIYIGEVGFVEYLPPGTKELADAVVSAMRDHDLVICRNHGQVAIGRDVKDVIQKAVLFELACQILLYQNKPRFLTQSDIDALAKP